MASYPSARPAGATEMSKWRHEPLRIDGAEYDFGDAAGTVRGVPHRWRWITEGLDDLPGGVVVALEAIADVLRSAGGEGDHLEPLSDSVQRELGLLALEHGHRSKLVDVLGENHPLTIATEECDRLLSIAGRAVAHEIAVPEVGRVMGVHVSDGGAPKAAVASAEVGARGLEGDSQAARDHHGRPFQAVCLYSADVIEQLRSEGHPVQAGSLGENLTIAGIDWSVLRPGVRLVIGETLGDQVANGVVDGFGGRVGGGLGDRVGGRVGNAASSDFAVLEISCWAAPCKTIAASFADRRFDRVDHDKHPGFSRAYAWPLRPGRVASGSVVQVLP